jgi:hypothetical protein
LIGAVLLYGDGVITPAISVLSAVEGLKLDAPGSRLSWFQGLPEPSLQWQKRTLQMKDTLAGNRGKLCLLNRIQSAVPGP